MPITQEQREQRRQFIGSSDVAAILGLDPFKTAADVWASKVFATEEKTGGEKDPRAAGNRMEKMVLEWGAEELGVEIYSEDAQGNALEIPSGKFLAHPDAIEVDAPIVHEAKTTRVFSNFAPESDMWGEPFTDEVPFKVLLQCNLQLYCGGPDFQTAWVPLYFGARGFFLYRIDRSDRIIETVIKRCEEWWSRFVETRECPPDSLPSLSTLESIKRERKTVKIPDQPLLDFLYAREIRLAAEKEEKEAKKKLLFTLGDADRAITETHILNYAEVKRKGYTVEPSTYRKLSPKVATQSEIEKIEMEEIGYDENSGTTDSGTCEAITEGATQGPSPQGAE